MFLWLIAILGSPLIRVSTNLYKMASWLGLTTVNAVSSFPMNARTSCLSPLNGGINFKASPTLIKSPFILEGSPLTALQELELGESTDRIGWVKTHRSRLNVPELLLLLAYISTRRRLSLEPCTAVSALPDAGPAVSAQSRTLNGGFRSPSDVGPAVSAQSQNLNGGFRFPSDAGQAASAQSWTLIVTQVVLDSLTLFVSARSSRPNPTSDTK